MMVERDRGALENDWKGGDADWMQVSEKGRLDIFLCLAMVPNAICRLPARDWSTRMLCSVWLRGRVRACERVSV